MQIGNYDVQSALDFCKLFAGSAFENLKSVRLMFNKYEIIKSAKFDETERNMVAATKLPFFKTRVKLSTFYSSKGYNSIVPSTFRINLNTLEGTSKNSLFSPIFFEDIFFGNYIAQFYRSIFVCNFMLFYYFIDI
jgi:hypothetical protein